MAEATPPPRKPFDDELDVAGVTHVGKVRPTNEDHFLLGSLHKHLDILSTSLPLPAGCLPLPWALPTLCPGAHGAGRRLRRWQLRARLHRALPPPARIPPASDAWPLTSPCLRSLTLV